MSVCEQVGHTNLTLLFIMVSIGLTKNFNVSQLYNCFSDCCLVTCQGLICEIQFECYFSVTS